MNRIKRARGTNSVMTGVFYLIAVFFFCTFDFICILCDYKRIQRCDSGNVPLSEKKEVLETSYLIRFILYSYHWYFPYRLE